MAKKKPSSSYEIEKMLDNILEQYAVANVELPPSNLEAYFCKLLGWAPDLFRDHYHTIYQEKTGRDENPYYASSGFTE